MLLGLSLLSHVQHMYSSVFSSLLRPEHLMDILPTHAPPAPASTLPHGDLYSFDWPTPLTIRHAGFLRLDLRRHVNNSSSLSKFAPPHESAAYEQSRPRSGARPLAAAFETDRDCRATHFVTWGVCLIPVFRSQSWLSSP